MWLELGLCRGTAAESSGTQVRSLKPSVGYQGVQKDLEGGLCQPPCLQRGKCIWGEGDMAMLGGASRGSRTTARVEMQNEAKLAR